MCVNSPFSIPDLYKWEKNIFKVQLSVCAGMSYSLLGARSTNKIKWILSEVDIKIFPDQAYSLQAVLLQLGGKPQPEVPEEILQKVRVDICTDVGQEEPRQLTQ